MKVLFRTDASPSIGMGHLERSVALATALRRHNLGSLFLTNDNALGQERVRHFGFCAQVLSCEESWSPEDIVSTIDLASENDCSIVVVDSHEVTAEYLAKLRKAGLTVVARDDLALYAFPCQVVVNGNADAAQLPYCSSSGDTTFLLGTRYIVLKEEFWEVPPRVVCPDIQNILVTVGGADQYNLVPQLLHALDTLPGDFKVTAVVGPFFQNVRDIEAAAEKARRPVKLVYQPGSLRNFMLEADLAVSAGGQTLYELAATGCPTVAIKVAENQDGQMRALAKAGCIRHCGEAGRDDVVSKVMHALTSLESNASDRHSVSTSARRLVDGQGALRVARSITDELSRGKAKNKETGNGPAFSRR